MKRKIQIIEPDPENTLDDDIGRMTTEFQLANELAEKLLTWQGIVDQSEADPKSVVEFLLPSKKFDIIYAWAKIFNISQELEQVLV